MHVYQVDGLPGTQIVLPAVAPDYPRLTPAQAAQMLAALPQPRLITRLVVVDGVHPDEPFAQQRAGKTRITMRGTVTPAGEMTLYKAEATAETARTMLHEWAHLHRLSAPAAADAFDHVGDLEPLSTSGRTLLTTADEPWPVLSETLFGPYPLLAAATAAANPIRASILAQSLAERLTRVPPQTRGLADARYQAVVALVYQAARPEALRHLRAAIHSGDCARQHATQRILAYLAG
jgi:uncharacterized protein YukE